MAESGESGAATTSSPPEGTPDPAGPASEPAGEATEPAPSKAEQRARAEAKNLRDRLKAAEAEAAKWREYERSQQSEAERWAAERSELAGQASAAEQRASAAERRLAQFEAAAEAGLPLPMAARIIGETPEEMAADAKALAKELGVAAQTRTAGERRKPDRSQAAAQSPDAEALALNGDPLTASLMRAVGLPVS